RGYVAGEEVLDYHQEPNVPADSNTPTYIAAKLEIDNWRWAGTPFYIRTGKRLAEPVPGVAGRVTRTRALTISPEAHDAAAASAVLPRSVGAPRGELAGAADPAGRGHLAALRRQGAVTDAVDPQRQHGLPVRLVVPDRRAGGVRDADPRCDQGRQHPVHAPGQRRAVVGDLRPAARAVADRPAADLCVGLLGPGRRRRAAGPP